MSSEEFDPYRKWLGIPPNEQPPNHYRLLGIALFEEDADVIQNAADRQMAHVRTFKMSRYSAESQKLLNELSEAKVCLLTPDDKFEYDAHLHAELAPPARPAEPRPVPPPVPVGVVPPALPAAPPPAAAPPATIAPPAVAVLPSVGRAAAPLPTGVPVVPAGEPVPAAVPVVGPLGASLAASLGSVSAPVAVLPGRPIAVAPAVDAGSETGPTVRSASPGTRPRSGDKESSATWMILLGVGGGVLAIAGLVFALNQSSNPTPNSKPPSTANSSTAIRPEPKPRPSTPVLPKPGEGPGKKIGPDEFDANAPIRWTPRPMPPQEATTSRPSNGPEVPQPAPRPLPEPPRPLPEPPRPMPEPPRPLPEPPRPMPERPMPVRPAPQPTAEGGLPVPTGTELKKAQEKLLAKYRDELNKPRDSNARAGLAAKLIRAAITGDLDPADRYVTFVKSWELAAEAGRVESALLIVEAAAEEFAIDPVAEKLACLEKAFSVPPLSGETAAEISAAARALYEPALAAREYELAAEAAKLSGRGAKAAGDIPGEQAARKQEDWVRDLATDQKAALKNAKNLETNPLEPAANFNVGKFKCWGLEEWEEGLPLLAKGTDPNLKSLATAELANPTEAAEMLKIGAGWLALAKRRDFLLGQHVAKHALPWLEKAEASGEGATREEAAAKLKEAKDFLRSPE